MSVSPAVFASFHEDPRRGIVSPSRKGSVEHAAAILGCHFEQRGQYIIARKGDLTCRNGTQARKTQSR